MAEKIAANQPLLAPFTAKCLEAFKDKPAEQVHFTGMTLADLVIGAVTRKDGVHTADINSTVRNFKAPKQSWTPASIHNKTAFTLTSADTLTNQAAVKALKVPGTYAYNGGAGVKIAVVLPTHTGDAAAQLTAAIAAVKDTFNYDLPAAQFVAGSTGTVLVSGDCILGEIEYVLAAEDPVEVPQDPQMAL